MCAVWQASKATSKSISVLTRHLLLTQLFPIIQEYLPLWNVFSFVKLGYSWHGEKLLIPPLFREIWAALEAPSPADSEHRSCYLAPHT